MLETFLQNNTFLFIISIIWVLPWKGYALWTSARKEHKIWFVLMLILNTFAILEIIYIFYFAKKTPNEVKDAVKDIFKKGKDQK